jgi:hypothetical protein
MGCESEGMFRFGSAAGGEISNGHENFGWISTASLLMDLRPDRVGRANSKDGSMAGFSLPEASRLQGAGLMAASAAKEPQGRPMEHEIKVGTVLIKNNTLLPEGLRLEALPAGALCNGVRKVAAYPGKTVSSFRRADQVLRPKHSDPRSGGRSGKGSRAREERSRRSGSTTAKQSENVSPLISTFGRD